MEKVLIFFVVRLVVILFGCQESVGKLKKKNFPIFPTSPARAQDTKFVQFFFIKKRKMLFGKFDHDLRGKVVFFSLAQKSWI